MLIIDSLLIGGIRFCLDKVLTAVDREMNDDTVLREELIAAQMRFELGEMSEADFHLLEGELLARIREIRERQMQDQMAEPEEGEGELKITGAEVTFEGDEHQ
jgi:hypothetical protein